MENAYASRAQHPVVTSMRPARVAYVLALVAGYVWLASCAETELAFHAAKRLGAPGSAPQGLYKVGKPYEIKGTWYYPRVDEEYVETGIASWYGPNFHGKSTANGERFDMNALTAAHRTLPLPSMVRVTNLGNGRSLVLRVNDRGPFARNRIIDVSRRAAELLGFQIQGTAKVQVEVLPNESRQVAALARRRGGDTTAVNHVADNGVVAAPRVEVVVAQLPAPGQEVVPPPTQVASATIGTVLNDATVTEPLPDGQVTLQQVRRSDIYVQAGAFADFNNANRVRARLLGIGKAQVTQVSIDGNPLFRVRLGPVASVEEGDSLLDRVVRVGYPQARLVVDCSGAVATAYATC